MERRDFLKGVFGGVTAAGLLVQARPEDVAAFAPPPSGGSVVVVRAPSPGAVVTVGETLYNACGVAVATVRRLDVAIVTEDMTLFADGVRTYVPGWRSCQIVADALALMR